MDLPSPLSPDDARKGIRGVDGSWTIGRFWSYVHQQPDGCWLWKGPVQDNGFGVVGRGMGRRIAHRVALEILGRSAIYNVGHRCHNKLCMNPDHMAPLHLIEEPPLDGRPRTERLSMAVSPGEREVIALAAGDEPPGKFVRRTVLQAAKKKKARAKKPRS